MPYQHALTRALQAPGAAPVSVRRGTLATGCWMRLGQWPKMA